MKFEFINSDDEKIMAYAKEKTKLIAEIESLCLSDEAIMAKNIYGYLENDIVSIRTEEISYVSVEDEKTLVLVKGKKYQLRQKLSEIEGLFGKDFLRINRSAIINVKHIKKFDSSWNGTLMVELKDGTKDFISRRRVKNVKERLGI